MENQYNYISGHKYEGVGNLTALFAAIKQNEYKSNDWLTFLQAKGLGLKIKKGSKGVKIFRGFASVEQKNKEGKIKVQSVPLGSHTVFNLEQFENLDEVDTKDIKLIKRNISGKTYIYAEPKEGNGYMFGGNFISTSNGVVYEHIGRRKWAKR